MQLTPHFSLAEFTASQVAARRGIANDPPVDLYPSLKRTAEGLERIRAIICAPVIITSGYRSPMLNQAVGGAISSQHPLGQAADITVPGMPPATLARRIDMARRDIGFDQLILEYPESGGWVHVSFAAHPRLIALTRLPGEYLRGIQS